MRKHTKEIRKQTKETSEYVRDNLRYDPETGYLWWIKPSNTRYGERDLHKPVGSYSRGYLIFNIPRSVTGNKNVPRVHRVAWFLYYGVWSEKQIDHINGIKSDNRIENLREVTQQQNLRNQKSRLTSSSKYKGVSWSKQSQKWRVDLRYSEKIKCLGLYVSEEEAARVYDKAARELHGYYARLNFPDEHEQGALHGHDL